jgi:ABC-type Fe3+-hydroxamate transport system substrate-binding protein
MNHKKVYLIAILTLVYNISSYAQTYNRIVSLSRSITQEIYLLGAKDKLVGCTSYCDFAIKDNKEVVASAVDVNIEKVIILRPDLVLTTTITTPEAIETLKKAGIKIIAFQTTKSYEEICQNLMQVAEYTGKTLVADQIIKKQKHRLDSIISNIPKGNKPRIFFEIGTKPIFTVLTNTFMNDFITFAGGENIASDLQKGTMTRESVFLRNPDVIVIVTMGILAEEERDRWASSKELNAAKNKKIFIIDSDKACSPTPVTFIDVVEELTKLIYNK